MQTICNGRRIIIGKQTNNITLLTNPHNKNLNLHRMGLLMPRSFESISNSFQALSQRPKTSPLWNAYVVFTAEIKGGIKLQTSSNSNQLFSYHSAHWWIEYEIHNAQYCFFPIQSGGKHSNFYDAPYVYWVVTFFWGKERTRRWKLKSIVICQHQRTLLSAHKWRWWWSFKIVRQIANIR